MSHYSKPRVPARPARPGQAEPLDFGNLAVRIIEALARIAPREKSPRQPLVEIVSAQVAGVSFANIGEPGLQLLEDWARSGARVRVPTFMNPCGMDTARWRELGISDDFARKQRRIIAALEQMGVTSSLTCTPYDGYLRPERGRHLAWSESSAVSCANSLFGARTNREGGPSALAAAICGRTPMTGYHLDENRVPTHVIRVTCPVVNEADFGALGLFVGQQVGGGVPCFVPLKESPPGVWRDMENLKALAAAMAASGAVALFHVAGVTPEAEKMADTLKGELTKRMAGLPEIVVENLRNSFCFPSLLRRSPAGRDEGWTRKAAHSAEAAVSAAKAGRKLDAVAIGCPHASLDEVRKVADLLRGRKVKTRLWVTTSRRTRDLAAAKGLCNAIERAGGKVLADMCLLVAPLAELGIAAVATNSAKTAYYLCARPAMSVCFGALEMCIKSAIVGEWRGRADDGRRTTDATLRSSDGSLRSTSRGILVADTDNHRLQLFRVNGWSDSPVN